MEHLTPHPHKYSIFIKQIYTPSIFFFTPFYAYFKVKSRDRRQFQPWGMGGGGFGGRPQFPQVNRN